MKSSMDGTGVDQRKSKMHIIYVSLCIVVNQICHCALEIWEKTKHYFGDLTFSVLLMFIQ